MLSFRTVSGGIIAAASSVLIVCSAVANAASYAYPSNNWSGYAATGRAYNQVQVEFTVPTVTCTVANANVLFWTGFDGFDEAKATAEQVGIGADCGKASAKPAYYAWWEMYPSNNIQKLPRSTISVRPGQRLIGTVTYNSGTRQYNLRLRNVQTNQVYSTDRSCGSGLSCKRRSAEWIAERKMPNPSKPTVYVPLAKWRSDPALFINAKASAGSTYKLKSIGSFSHQPINMIVYPRTGGMHTLAAVSGLAQNGTSFNDAWHTAR